MQTTKTTPNNHHHHHNNKNLATFCLQNSSITTAVKIIAPYLLHKIPSVYNHPPKKKKQKPPQSLSPCPFIILIRATRYDGFVVASAMIHGAVNWLRSQLNVGGQTEASNARFAEKLRRTSGRFSSYLVIGERRIGGSRPLGRKVTSCADFVIMDGELKGVDEKESQVIFCCAVKLFVRTFACEFNVHNYGTWRYEICDAICNFNSECEGRLIKHKVSAEMNQILYNAFNNRTNRINTVQTFEVEQK